MREGKVVKPRNMPQRKREVCGGLAIGRIEAAILGGVLIDAHIYMECALYFCHRARYLHVDAIRRDTGDGQAVLFGEIDHRIIILLRRPELLRELIYREELPVTRTAWVVEILQELIQLVLIAQRQRDHQV